MGAVLAGLGLWGEKVPANLPPGTVARVNDVPILREDYERAVAALQADRRGALQPGDRAHVLDRLIEEELLVQRGLELGFVRYDRRVRADLTRAVIDSVVSEVEDAAPTEEELHAFFAANRSFFVQAGRLRARQVFVSGRGSRSGRDHASSCRRSLRASGSGARRSNRVRTSGPPALAVGARALPRADGDPRPGKPTRGRGERPDRLAQGLARRRAPRARRRIAAAVGCHPSARPDGVSPPSGGRCPAGVSR